MEGQEADHPGSIVGKERLDCRIQRWKEITGYIPFASQHYRQESVCFGSAGREHEKNAGILDGDYVIAEKVPTASDGEIVVALLEEEATVKRLYREPDGVRLQPENPDFEPIYSKDVSILGRVVSVIRYY